jgi:hypothetical protein
MSPVVRGNPDVAWRGVDKVLSFWRAARLYANGMTANQVLKRMFTKIWHTAVGA